MKIGLGSDHNAYVMKEEIKAYVQTLGYEVHDYGCSSCTEVDYPDVAFRLPAISSPTRSPEES